MSYVVEGFNGPLVIGAHRGLRQWRIVGLEKNSNVCECGCTTFSCLASHSDYALASTNWYYVWQSGVNVSAHWRSDNYYPYRPYSIPNSEYPDPDNPHEPSASCSCGFYSYHIEDYWSMPSGGQPVVAGLIEAWGRMVKGEKGSRASKALVVALASDIVFRYPNVTEKEGQDFWVEVVRPRIEERYPNVAWFENRIAMLEVLPVGDVLK